MWRRPIASSYVVYSTTDPGIDLEKSNLAEYTSTLDPKHLVWKPDSKPTEFHLAPINTSQRAEVISLISELPKASDTGLLGFKELVEASIQTLAYSLRKVTNFYIGETELVVDLSNVRAAIEAMQDPSLVIELANHVGLLSHLPFQVGEQVGS